MILLIQFCWYNKEATDKSHDAEVIKDVFKVI